VTAAALLAKLDAAGVRLSLAEDDLRYQTRPGVSIEPYRDRISANKLALRSELLKAEICAALDVEPAAFDRPAYLRLMARWYATEAEVENGRLGEGSERFRQPRDAVRSAGNVRAGGPPTDGFTDPAKPFPPGCGVPKICSILGSCPGYRATSICPLTPVVKTEPAA
jgi:hypothetical protein